MGAVGEPMTTPSVAMLAAIMPRAPIAWLLPLSLEMGRWLIESRNEVAAFLAQIAHESAELTRLEENLRYSAERLMQVWPRRFPDMLTAREYAGRPDALANTVYANRLGNGDAASGDGWRFRGRGPIQITGRANYRDFGELVGDDLEFDPDVVIRAPLVGCRVACAYWRTRVRKTPSDSTDVRADTQAVNGGLGGLEDRQRYFALALSTIPVAAA